MLEARNLTKRYGDFTALDNLTFTIKGGDIFCLLGANGAGKSTTINLFLNFIKADEGSAIICGKDVSEYSLETKKHLTYIPENLMLYPNLTGRENLDFFSRLSGKAWDKEELSSIMLQAGLQLKAHDQRVNTYSKGMRQKVGIAIALAKDADVLLLDEPTSGLDPKASNEFAGLLRSLREEGKAILMATHDLFRAKETGTHLGIMREGKLLSTLATKDINHSDLEKLYLFHMN